MSVEVHILTILRTYTGGEKAVPCEWATLSEFIDHLESGPVVAESAWANRR